MIINFKTEELKPMYEWLLQRKKGIKDEKELRRILNLPMYQVEFARYNEPNLPVCGISYEEAVDFFMHFDEKKFINQRLELKKPYFVKFYNDLKESNDAIKEFINMSNEDKEFIEMLLKNGLPNKLNKDLEYNIIFIISIGNSMGWPYENYIDFDMVNIGYFNDKKTFLSIVAHEIHHTKFEELIPEEMKSEELFLLSFAFEGLAVHFNNNASTMHKKSKYEGDMVGMDLECWNIYDAEFDLLFKKFKEDYYKCKSLSIEETQELISIEYEQFYATNMLTNEKFEARQYPTYYLGCYIYGTIDLALGKEELFKAMMNPSTLVETYNKAAKIIGNSDYLI